MRASRMTIRRLMILVAVAAVGLGLWRRWSSLAAQAGYHARMEAYYRAMDAGEVIRSVILPG